MERGRNNGDSHLKNAREIIGALERIQQSGRHREKGKPKYLDSPIAKRYQRYIGERFADVINIPSFEYVSKTDKGWLLVGDNRNEIAAKISVIIERYGIGVGMLVLHAQQMNTGYIPLSLKIGDEAIDLTHPTSSVYGARKERVLNVPIRKYRSDDDRLAEFNIAKPKVMYDQSQIVRHKGDRWDCKYCSAKEMFPGEVIVTIQGSRFGLSRNYSFGFTFAPFGNPLTVVHFLAWDQSEKPLNMNRTPVTVSDLVIFTRLINLSIAAFFGGTGIDDFPIIDGISNGWAGNSIYHQHFQFFELEFELPIRSETLVNRQPILKREDVEIHRLSWELPIYRIKAEESINVGLIGNDLAGAWRLKSDVKILHPHETAYDGFEVLEKTEMRFHTQNLYVPGAKAGRVAYILLRDRSLIDFTAKDAFVDKAQTKKAQPKKNIGVLEASGMMVNDDPISFAEMSGWEPNEISRQIDLMTEAVCPDRAKTEQFEADICGLFPPE